MRFAFVNPQGNFDPDNSYLAAHPDFGGQLVYVREVALALADAGHHADIVTRQIIDPEWPEFSELEDSYPDSPNVRILRIPCGPEHFLPKEELWPYLGEWVEGIQSFYERENILPDIFTGHYADGGLCAALLEERTGVPMIFTGHSLGAWKVDSLLSAGEELADVDRRYNFGPRIVAERVAASRAAAVVTSSESERREQYDHPAYREAIEVGDDRRFAVIPPGVDLEVFDADGESSREEEVRTSIRTALERDVDPDRRELPAVIAWSRLDPKKNHRALVRAFAGSPELREKANLLMVTRGLEDPLREPEKASSGDKEVLDGLIAEIEEADLWGSVSMFTLAGQDALAALYRWGRDQGSVFCLPAEYEPFGLTLVEAMAAGLPVVATSNGGPQEITDHGKAGLLADPYDYEELATRFLQLFGDSGAWNRYAASGRERAVELYSWQRTAEDYANLTTAAIRGERRGESPQDRLPIPDFIKDGPEESSKKLPRLESWEAAEEADGTDGA